MQHKISIQATAFAPGEVELQIGDTILFTNDDTVARVVTFDPQATYWQASKKVPPGQTVESHRFTHAGMIPFSHCGDGKGVVTVKENNSESRHSNASAGPAEPVPSSGTEPDAGGHSSANLGTSGDDLTTASSHESEPPQRGPAGRSKPPLRGGV